MSKLALKTKFIIFIVVRTRTMWQWVYFFEVIFGIDSEERQEIRGKESKGMKCRNQSGRLWVKPETCCSGQLCPCGMYPSRSAIWLLVVNKNQDVLQIIVIKLRTRIQPETRTIPYKPGHLVTVLKFRWTRNKCGSLDSSIFDLVCLCRCPHRTNQPADQCVCYVCCQGLSAELCVKYSRTSRPLITPNNLLAPEQGKAEKKQNQTEQLKERGKEK